MRAKHLTETFDAAEDMTLYLFDIKLQLYATTFLFLSPLLPLDSDYLFHLFFLRAGKLVRLGITDRIHQRHQDHVCVF